MNAFLIATLLLASDAAAPSSEPMAPSGKWTVEYGDAACMLSREYGGNQAPVTVGFRPAIFGNTVDMIVLSGGMHANMTATAKVTFEPSGRNVIADVFMYGIKSKNQTGAKITFKSDAAADLGSALSIAVAFPDGTHKSIAVPGMEDAFAALRTCGQDLLKTWGVDPAESEGMQTPPVQISNSYRGDDKYPTDAFLIGAQGTAITVFSVNTSGKVEHCKIVKSSGNASLDQATCRTYAGNRYKSAVGLDGHAMMAHVIGSLTWKIPD